MKYLFFCALIFIILLSCSEPTVPPPPPNTGPDTTSHNFTWTIDTFGMHSNSKLYDVSIISEDNIWAVGEIFTDEKTFNAVHWNGSNWELKTIPVKIFNSNVFIPAITTAIIAFAKDNIFAYSSGEIIHYDGIKWGDWHFLYSSYYDSTFGGFNKLWGPTPNNIYGAGNKGTINHFNGQSWEHIESGTHLNIRDIWGSEDHSTGNQEILALASSTYATENGRKILKISNSMVSTVSDSGLPIDLSALWFRSNEKYFVGGHGLFYSDSTGNNWKRIEFPNYYITDIRGNDLNDFFVVGNYGFASHFNGLTWYHYVNKELPQFDGGYSVIRQHHNKVVIVGEYDRKAIVITGIRNN